MFDYLLAGFYQHLHKTYDMYLAYIPVVFINFQKQSWGHKIICWFLEKRKFLQNLHVLLKYNTKIPLLKINLLFRQKNLMGNKNLKFIWYNCFLNSSLNIWSCSKHLKIMKYLKILYNNFKYWRCYVWKFNNKIIYDLEKNV